MRLLQKTNRAYFLISLTTLLIAGVILYFVLSWIFRSQLNESLLSDIEVVKKTIEKNNVLPNYYPYIEVVEAPQKSVGKSQSNDTLIFDQGEDELVPYRQIRVVTLIKGKKYFIAARDTLLEKSDLLLTIIIVTGFVFLIMLVILYYVNKRLSLKIWQPFYKTLDELKEFSHDNPGFRLTSESDTDEFRELNNALDKLTQRIISDYQSLKRFTEDASHEIQTPLAVIQSKLETLMQDPGLKKGQAELLSSAYTYTLKVSRLTQTLLLLTKIANDQFPDKKQVYFSQIIEEKESMLADIIGEKDLVINKDIDREVSLETNLFLAESLVMNLLENAIKHSNPSTTINIMLNKNRFEIANSGTPLNVPPQKIFERFYKINKSSDNHGLGLSIVNEICSVNKWEINYKYENDRHKFIVIF
jgi:signal transduction histidine kinase